jgi:hypothetical protein
LLSLIAAQVHRHPFKTLLRKKLTFWRTGFGASEAVNRPSWPKLIQVNVGVCPWYKTLVPNLFVVASENNAKKFN